MQYFNIIREDAGNYRKHADIISCWSGAKSVVVESEPIRVLMMDV